MCWYWNLILVTVGNKIDLKCHETCRFDVFPLQTKCTGESSWTSSAVTDRSKEICRYKPLTAVTCQIRAKNDYKDPSDVINKMVTTPCLRKD